MLYVKALKEGVVGPDWQGVTKTFRLDEASLIKDSDKGYYETRPEVFEIIDIPDASASLPEPLNSELIKAFNSGRFYGADVDRFASIYNRVNTARLQASYIPSGSSAAGKRRLLTYHRVKIGSGDRKSLTLVLENQFYDVSTAGMPPVANANSMLVTGLRMQRSTGGTIVQLTRGGVGAGSLTLAATDFDIKLDDVSPGQFGLSSFALDSEYFVQVEVEVDYNQFFVVREGADIFGTEGYVYDPAINTWNTALTNQPSAPAWSVGNSSTVQQVIGYGVIVVGKFVSGDPVTIAAFGDSIWANGNGGLGTASYIGKLFLDQKIAGCIIGRVGGSTTSMQSGARSMYLTKYGNTGAEEYNTNSSGETLAQLQARSQTAWSLIRGAAIASPRNHKFNILRPYLLLACSTNKATSTVFWNAGGKPELYNEWLETQEGLSNGPDIVFDPSIGPAGTIRRSLTGKGVLNSDYYRWADNTNQDPDGAGFAVHPSPNGAAICAGNMAPFIPVL